MHFGAKPDIFGKARRLRNNLTSEENALWQRLRKSQLGVRFKSQHPINQFIADFYCHKAKLIIEIDGSSHDSEEAKDYDSNRTYELEQLGLKIIRFSNKEVMTDIEGVLEKIKHEISRTPLDP